MVPAGFFESVLKSIDAPVSANNLSFLHTWAKHEGGKATFNPLNTTQNAPGATNYNSATVKNYPDFKTGVAATAKTLQNRFYPNILSALRKSQPLGQYFNNPQIDSNMRTWGTVNFAIDLMQSDVNWIMVKPNRKQLIGGLAALLVIGVAISLLFMNKSEIESIK